ncbi:hypothetical protein OKW22_001257 [Bacilli bacterium PM5-3]|nr:hypothetical protein [Bacilli bacterium PM5-3]
MPAFATHFFYAKKVYEESDKEVKKLIERYRSYYDLGAQGPDIFFYYKPYKRNNIAAYGSSLHNKQAKRLFEDAIKKIKEVDDQAAFVYLLGLGTHFSLDSSFHPIINKKYTEFNDHMILEAELDRRIIEQNVRFKPHKFRRNLLINARYKYGYDLQFVYPKIDSKYIDESIYQTNFYMKVLYSPNNIKGKIISLLCKTFIKGADFSNLIIKKKPNTAYDKTVDELIKKYPDAITTGVNNLKNLVDVYNGKAKMDKYFYNTFE